MREDEINFYSGFIELYKSMPSLWKVNSPEYSNRKLKSKCYEKMVEKLREMDPHANRDRVIKKINVFRTNYKRDLRRKKMSENNGEEFRSSLWYFDKFKFLEEQQSGDDEQCTKDKKKYNFNIRYVDDNVVATSPPTYKHADEKIMANSLPKKRKLTVEDNLLEIACQKLINCDEASSILSKAWAIQYQELSKEQQVFTRIIMADVLFHGCLNKITEQTVEDVHKVLQGISVNNHEHSEQTPNDYIEEYENTSSPQHSRSPSLEKTETFF